MTARSGCKWSLLAISNHKTVVEILKAIMVLKVFSDDDYIRTTVLKTRNYAGDIRL
jgi:hypothetical protein